MTGKIPGSGYPMHAGVPQDSHAVSQAFSAAPYLGVAGTVGTAFSKCLQSFWNRLFRVQLLSIAEMPHYFWHLQDFYVAQKGLDEEGKRWAQLRLSEGLCQNLFETTLGKALEEPTFSLAQVRNFEVFTLERFSRAMFQEVTPLLLKKPGPKAPPVQSDPLIHFVWALNGERDQVCQLVLTVPHACLKAPPAPTQPPVIWSMPESQWMRSRVTVWFRVGSTRARLEELQQLEPGDLLVFENSHRSQWLMLNPDQTQWLPVPVRVPARYQFTHGNEQGWMAMTHDLQNKPNLWDNLQVDVSATFSPIRLPLRQLKEMEQGLVLEVGDVMDNRIHIEVEGNPVAWGELLILGDKFAVRIQGLHDQIDPRETMLPSTPEVRPVMASPPPGVSSLQSGPPVEVPLEPVFPEPPTEAAPNANDMMDLDLDESDFDDLDDEEDWT